MNLSPPAAGLRGLAGYLRLEVSRTVRDVRYVVLALAAPVGFYLLFAEIFSGTAGKPASGSGSGSGLPASVEIMVAMATFGAMWGALSATAPRLARDRERGWLDALRVTPMSPAAVLAARICAGLLSSLPAIVAVGVTGRLAHDVSLTAAQWGLGLIALWLGTVPFVMLGIAIGTMTDSTTAYGVSMGLYFAFAALGGLWVPPAVFPSALRQVAKTLPSYNQADLGWQIAGHHAPTAASVLVLAAWTAGLAAIAYWAGARIRPGRQGRTPSAPDPAAAAAELAGVGKSYGAVQALTGLDLDIGQAAIVALLGPNGAGKTTAIRIMLGLLGPDDGQARLFGSRPPGAIAAGQVGAMLQDAELMSGVTVGQLLRFIRGLYPDPLDYQEAVRVTGVEPILGRRTDRLSTGQAQRARFAVALIGNPRLLVLDEPTAGLDVRAQQVFWDDVRSYRASGQTVLFSTHYLEEADHNADRIVVIQSGHMVADGTPEQVRSAGGAGRTVRFTWLGDLSAGFASLPGVTAIDIEDREITLHTTDSDATVWSLYNLRGQLTGLEVAGGGLREAFLSLTGAARSG
jgi:ABC-2 type transport system ATP-binding protein